MAADLLKSLSVAMAVNLLAFAQPGQLAAQLTTIAKAIESNPNTAPGNAPDPRAYLDEIEGTRAIAWVKAHNQTTLDRLSKDPRFARFQAEALKILEATDRIATPSFAHNGMVRNFWQDGDHVQGIWRQTTWTSYASGKPDWGIILDIDALSRAEGKNWVWEGADCLAPEYTRCLISLSDGGKDANVVREFDIPTRRFVQDGFQLPEGKQGASWRDANTIYVTREWAPGDMTTSSYAYITKRLTRGQRLDQAVEIFRGTRDDVSAGRSALRDIDGKYVMDMSYRGLDFFHTRIAYYSGDTAVELPVPTSVNFTGYMDGQAIYSLKEAWTSARGTVFKTGAVVAFDLKTALADPAHIEPTVIFQPDAHQSVQGIAQTKTRLVLSVLSNVTGAALSFTHRGGTWTATAIPLPANAALTLESADNESDHVLFTVSSFLIPPTLYRIDAGSAAVETIRATPARFDATGLAVQQFWATSKDGTKVPYFFIARKGIPLDGTTPTILNAYGGFEISSTPSYSGTVGKLWLEQGGAFVLANIRGGGEFGPAWHEAGLKTRRQNIYDDFQAVAEDLIARRITTPRRLGIMGGSNGGLLMGVQLTQRPDLWNAVDVQVPLLDMVNFTHMSAGASWQGEYGNPDDSVEGAFLRHISPYHNVKAGMAYPEPLFETSTKDDRVGPVHARKMAALFEDMGLPFHYYENIEGGHAAAANLPERARRYAIDYTYFAQKLMDN